MLKLVARGLKLATLPLPSHGYNINIQHTDISPRKAESYPSYPPAPERSLIQLLAVSSWHLNLYRLFVQCGRFQGCLGGQLGM